MPGEEGFSTKEVVLMMQKEKEDRIKMMQQEKEERMALASELLLTRQSLKKYNGLVEKIDKHEKRITVLEYKEAEEDSISKWKKNWWEFIRKYSVWVIGLITFGYWLAQVLGGVVI